EFYFNDLYLLDIKSKQWIKGNQSNLKNVPSERNRCSCILLKETEDVTSLFYFGGNYFNMHTRRDDFFNDGYLLTLKGRNLKKLIMEWKKFKDVSTVMRGHHTCTSLDDTIYMFGG